MSPPAEKAAQLSKRGTYPHRQPVLSFCPHKSSIPCPPPPRLPINSFTIGASAAVCGLIGATLYYGKSRGGVYGQAIFRQIGGWALGLFLFGLLVPGVNNWGHGGGICAGVILGLLLGYQERARENLYHRILAGVCVALTVLILAWAVVSGIYYRILG